MQRRLLFTIPSYAISSRFLAAGVRARRDRAQELPRRRALPRGSCPTSTDATSSSSAGRRRMPIGSRSSTSRAASLVAARARSAIVMPYFGYSTMERAVSAGRGRGRQDACASPLGDARRPEGGTHLFLFDLHTDGIEFYLDDRILSRHVYGAPIDHEEDRRADGRYAASSSARATPAARSGSRASRATSHVEPAFVYKRRDPPSGGTSVTGVNADVQGQGGRGLRRHDPHGLLARPGGQRVSRRRARRRCTRSRATLVLPGDAYRRSSGRAALFASIIAIRN